jgi:arabinofuranosyltransferase
LLARLPLTQETLAKARPGHFRRPLPAGYRKSVRLGDNFLPDGALRDYYDLLRSVTRAPIWDRQRVTDLIELNFARSPCFDSLDE